MRNNALLLNTFRGKPTLKHRLALLIMAFVAAFTLFGALAFDTLNTLKVNGPYYHKIALGKDLVSDILPPPEYLLETYLVAHQMADPANRPFLAGLTLKSEGLRHDFDDRHKYWADNLPDSTESEKQLKQAMVVDSYQPALRFLAVFHDQFLPAVQRGDYRTAAQLLHGPLQTEYEAHRTAIDQVVTLTDASNQIVEDNAARIIAARLAVLAVLGIIIVAGTAYSLSRFLQQSVADALAQAAPAASTSETAVTPAEHEQAGHDQAGHGRSLSKRAADSESHVSALALNKALEASRNSEAALALLESQDRGLGLVAAEFRHLADENAKLSEQIARLVSHLQSGVASVCFVLLCILCLAGSALPASAQAPATVQIASSQPAPIPAEAAPGPKPDACRVGAYVTGLSEFDLVKKSFQIDFWMWAISPKYSGPLKTLELVNASASKEQYDQTLTTTDPYHNFGADRKVFYSQRKFIGTIRSDWDEENYPFDRHVLLVEMEDANNDATAIVYLPDTQNTRISEGVKLDGWKVTNTSFTERKNTYDTTFGDPKLKDGESTYSRVALAISIERETRLSFWKLTAGVYAAFVLSLLAFFYDSDQTSLMSARSSIIVGSLFAAIINMRASEGVLGHSEHLTLIDKIHILTIFYVFAGALLTVISRLISEKSQGKTAMYLDRRVFFPVFLTSYIAINIVLVWLASFQG